MKKHASPFVAAALLALAATPTLAEVAYNWGTPVFSDLKDSYGNGLDATYTFQLGVFAAGFTPDSNNVTSWASNWKVFDQAAYNVDLGYFASTANLQDDGTSSSGSASPSSFDFRGYEAYIWGYNSQAYGTGMEWVWFRATNWTFPTIYTPGPTEIPVDWSTSDLNANDTPLWGRQSNSVGLGYASAPGTHDLQTYTVTPEPSTLALLALAGGALLARRLRRRRNP